jgi:hypothetical protein
MVHKCSTVPSERHQMNSGVVGDLERPLMWTRHMQGAQNIVAAGSLMEYTGHGLHVLSTYGISQGVPVTAGYDQ